MQALSEYMRESHFVCLGDVVALQVKSTPLLGPMLTSAAEKASGGSAAEVRSIAFLKIFELTAHQDFNSHKADVRYPTPPPPPAGTCPSPSSSSRD